MPSWREDERLHDLNDLLFFAAVVEHSGFSAAARSLNLPKSSVSRHVGRLEDRLGVRLLERSTRNVRLTEIGSSYYARCKAILSELETAEHDLALLRSDPIGTIRVSCPTGLAQYALARIVPRPCKIWQRDRDLRTGGHKDAGPTGAFGAQAGQVRT